MPDDYQKTIDLLARAKRVLVTTHVRPDGDALGSSAALVLGLRQKGIDAEVLLLSHLPTKHEFLFQELGIPHEDVEKGWPEHFPFETFDTFLVVDTGTWSQLPGLKERVENWAVPKVVIDHHLTQEPWGDHRLVDTRASAAGEIVAELLRRWGVAFDKPLATAIYLAVASDTGWFQFSNTRPQTMRLAADLMEVGVDTDRLYQLLYQNERAQRVALQARALQSLELLAGGWLAVMTIRKQDFTDTGANVPDSENLINVPLQIATVEVSILISEPRDFGPIRVSFRSKGQVNVAEFASQFGGGGHARASGAKFDKATLADVHERVVGGMVKAMGSTLVPSLGTPGEG